MLPFVVITSGFSDLTTMLISSLTKGFLQRSWLMEVNKVVLYVNY
jgi:hypothetical protein